MSAHARAEARFKREVALAYIRSQRAEAATARAEAAKAAEAATKARRHDAANRREQRAADLYERAHRLADQMAALCAAGRVDLALERQLTGARIRAEGARIDSERRARRRKRRPRSGPSNAVCTRPRRRPDWIA